MAMDQDAAVAAAVAAVKAALEVNGMSSADADDASSNMEATIVRPIVEAVISEIVANAETSADGESIT